MDVCGDEDDCGCGWFEQPVASFPKAVVHHQLLRLLFVATKLAAKLTKNGIMIIAVKKDQRIARNHADFF
ncbi:MAG: hypothetical protein ACJ8AT_05780 [Hyalangium sp.]